MAAPSLDTEVKAAFEAAQSHIDNFYQSINSGNAVSTYYVSSSKRYASITPDLSINGHHFTDPAGFEKLLEDQGSRNVRYEVDSFDAQVLNPSFSLGDAPPQAGHAGSAAPSARARSEARMSVLAQVTGRLRFGRGKEAPQRDFNEVFILVPNWDVVGARNVPRNARKWLIMSQTFRAL